MIERFSHIVRAQRLEPRLTAEAVNTMRVCEALCESARLGEIVTLASGIV